MVNDLIKGALLGVFSFIWYYVATAAPYVGSGTEAVSDGFMFFTIVAAALLAGK